MSKAELLVDLMFQVLPHLSLCPVTLPNFEHGWDEACYRLSEDLGLNDSNDPTGSKTCRECVRRELVKALDQEEITLDD